MISPLMSPLPSSSFALVERKGAVACHDTPTEHDAGVGVGRGGSTRMLDDHAGARTDDGRSGVEGAFHAVRRVRGIEDHEIEGLARLSRRVGKIRADNNIAVA